MSGFDLVFHIPFHSFFFFLIHLNKSYSQLNASWSGLALLVIFFICLQYFFCLAPHLLLNLLTDFCSRLFYLQSILHETVYSLGRDNTVTLTTYEDCLFMSCCNKITFCFAWAWGKTRMGLLERLACKNCPRIPKVEAYFV